MRVRVYIGEGDFWREGSMEGKKEYLVSDLFS